VRSNPRPAKILDELKAHEEPGGFKSFVNGRNVDTDVKKGLVAAIWLKEHGYPEFAVDHFNTCFSMVKWQMPDDPSQILRNMARSRSGFLRHVAGKAGLYELTAKGLNEYATIT
jgi:hypothetical protein